jgi:hypothetical protein
LQRAPWEVLATGERQEVRLVELVLVETLLRLDEDALEGAELEFEFVSQCFGEVLVDAGDRQALCPRYGLLLALSFTRGSSCALMIVILID